MRIKQAILAWVVAFVVFGVCQTRAASHVRVILDVSGSMRNNDPDKRAILATVLLHDLAEPNTTLGDTFKVLPFDERQRTADGSWAWPDPSAPMPVSRRDWIAAATNHRQAFVHALTERQQYDSIRTYFYPGLLRSIEDIEAVSRAKDDIRVIVLVTDGAPEPATRVREAELIGRDLAPRLETSSIRLYILGFSQEAHTHSAFFDSMIRAGGQAPLGASYVDLTGDHLLDNMLEIFGRSFGYSPDRARSLPGVRELDLENNVSPERVAVVVATPGARPPLKLELTAPRQGLVQDPAGARSASVPAASYRLRWILTPDPGLYDLDTDVTRGSVAVLRPSRLDLEVRPLPPNSAQRAMAETKLPLRVLVRPRTGAGDPGLVKLSFQPFGPRSSDPRADPYLWQGKENAASSQTGQLTPEGRIYEIQVEFPSHPEAPAEKYGGFLELEARRGEARVAALVADFAHRVEVHPPLALTPFPLAELASTSALGAGENACVSFKLELSRGTLPHPERPDYGLSAALAPDPGTLDQELRDASFTLDDRVLEFEGHGSGEWYHGRTLAREDLLGSHEICLRLGEPRRGDVNNPLEIPLEFTLQESPYDEFDVVQSFVLRARIKPPRMIDVWGRWILAGLTLFAIAAAFWYLRDRPDFPDDFRYAVARQGASAGLTPRELPEGTAFARLLGLVAERPIQLPGESKILGHLRPVDRDLYRIKPAKGVRIEFPSSPAKVPRRGRLFEVEAHRPYHLRQDGKIYLFRVEYR